VVLLLCSVTLWICVRAFGLLPVTGGTVSHHFATLRAAGLSEQRADATRRLNRLRRQEFDERFPGLLALVVNEPED
jgi:DNA-binding transcriptional ArsR family regulator